MTQSPTKKITKNNLLFHLGLLTRNWRKVLNADFQNCGLTEATWRPLLHLSHLGDGIRQKDLAASVGIEGPSMVRLVETLIAKGLVHRAEDRTDRRAKLLSLTDMGHSMVARIRETVVFREEQLLNNFSGSELEQLTCLVERLETAVADARQKGK
ncbi:Transcriptional regulator, MarR family [Citrifermentans bremense]|uniref:Transcriptional regulator, MarR family n=1 Tax=Citrifermentans bremense TaxID=60035 RepID=A0A6S6M1U3_9BACT|nr:MarR family transcriptional regulator [Citrifermentans bremense]BCG47460.1 Transcriptional regulator, MarR family [Citrifermentans bremense]